ncbi:MAG: 2-amino-4-hydroxy-6-hydroxymethyldihydropteridine diphosphokinase [Bacteroidales bacterium]|mgnify:CR=1 FL=1|nr:2-amino-4-hydroxy-6-hydroxymethyldihydropteridine diphosphokinase [Bacteroidales bacterium]
MSKHIIYLGLGSNLGDGKMNLDKAVELLSREVGEIIKVSTYIESEPWGFESKNIFTNGAVAMTTSLSPLQLLEATQAIEREMGRTHKHQQGEGYRDRIIDIDILLYDNLEIHSERLTIPHPLIKERDFVKIPLEEITPQNTSKF